MKVYLDWQLSGDRAYLERALAAREARDRVCLDHGRLGRRSRRRARRRRSTTPTTSSSSGRIRSAASTTSARSAPVEEMAGADERRGGARRVPAAVRRRPRLDRREPVQRRVLHPAGERAAARADRAGADEHDGLRSTPTIPSTRWATGAWSISSSASTRPRSPASGRWSIRRTCRTTLETIYRYNYKRELLRARHRAAHLRAQRRSGARHRRLRARRPAGRPVPVLRGGVDRARVPDRQPDDLRGNGAAGRRVHHQHSRALRRRAPQSVGRAGVRIALRPRDVVVDGHPRAERLPLRRTAAARVTALPRQPVAELPVLLVHGERGGARSRTAPAASRCASRCCTASWRVVRSPRSIGRAAPLA